MFFSDISCLLSIHFYPQGHVREHIRHLITWSKGFRGRPGNLRLFRFFWNTGYRAFGTIKGSSLKLRGELKCYLDCEYLGPEFPIVWWHFTFHHIFYVFRLWQAVIWLSSRVFANCCFCFYETYDLLQLPLSSWLGCCFSAGFCWKEWP